MAGRDKRKDHGSKVTVRVETITPKRAAEDLERSQGANYRTLTRSSAELLAKEMKDGLWELNGETIKYNGERLLIDGQHRMLACTIADVPFKTFVAYGVGSDMNIDTGRPRRLADILRRRGQPYYTVLAGALWWVWRQETKGWHTNSQGRAPHGELMRLLDQNPEIVAAVDFVAQHVGRDVGMHAMLAAVKFYTDMIDRKHSDWFFDRLGSGVRLEENDPVYRLRKSFLNDRGPKKTKKMTVRTKLAFIIKCFNASRAGEEMQILRWVASGPNAEPFPRLDGLERKDDE